MAEKDDIISIIKQRGSFYDLVFQRGYLITSNTDYDLSEIEFCKNWTNKQFGHFIIWIHPNSHLYYRVSSERVFFLIGHAYNPIKFLYKEDDILEDFSVAFRRGKSFYQEVIDEITGIYLTGIISEEEIVFQTDAVAMSVAYWGYVNDSFYLSSHCNLIACVEKLSRNPYVDKLVSYKFYKYFGAGLPGDLSSYYELTRVQCNFEYRFFNNQISFNRIFPCTKLVKKPYETLIEEISTILEKNIELIVLKWGNRASIGLTGGRDSTTTLSGAHNCLTSIKTFSYVSCEGEAIDAAAAEQIANAVGVSHMTIPVELSSDETAECDDIGTIIEYNMGSIGRIKDKEIKKRVFFLHHSFFEVEVKSWVDEIGRARLHKRYLKRTFPRRVRPRYLTTIYKFIPFNRKLVRETDRVFKEFLDKYYSKEVFDCIPWWDLLYWEYTWTASEALHLFNEHMLTADVTIPFNNRNLLKLMLSVSLDKRISDSIQIDVIDRLLPIINQTGIHVKDFGWNKKREVSERIYWEIQTKLPF